MNEEKMTLKESVWLTLRAWRFYWKNTPRFVLSTVLWALADAVSPYAVVWFSARLVAELSDAQDPQALAVDVAWVLGVTALLTLVRSVLLHWKSVEREQLNWQLGHDCFMEKQMSMDYADEDSQQVYDRYNFIQQSENFCSGGNPNAVALLDSVSAAVFRILGGAVLSVGLRQYKPEFSVYITLITGMLMLGAAVTAVKPVIETISGYLQIADPDSSYADVLVKSLAVCYITQMASDSCADAGEKSIAAKIELAGKFAIVLLALPVFDRLTEVIKQLLQ